MRMMPLSVKSAIASAVLLLTASAAQAELTTYTSQSAYLAAVGTTGVDDYDDLIVDSFETPIVRAAGAIGYTASTGPTSTLGYGASDDESDFWLTTNNRRDSITFDQFSRNIAGAGGFFFGSDLFGFSTPADSITITATDSTGATLTYTISDPGLSSFVGFVSSAHITSLSVNVGDQPGVWPTVNDLHLSVAAVPEPETYGMMLGGLGILGFLARRRQRQG